MSRSEDFYILDPEEDAVPDTFSKRFKALHDRLVGLEALEAGFNATLRGLIDSSRNRIDDALLPAFERVQIYQELGFMTAEIEDGTNASFAEGSTSVILTEANREAFGPSPFIALVRASTVDDFAIAQLDAYDKASGVLVMNILSAVGDPGPHTDVSVYAVAGSIPAMHAFVETGKVIRDATAQLKTDVADLKEETNTLKETAVERAGVAVAQAGIATDKATIATTKAGVATGAATLASDKAGEASDSAEAAAQSVIDAAAIAGFDANDYYDKIETDAQIATAVSNLLDGAPGALDTLNELAAAVNDDASFAATITASLAALSTVATTGSFNDLTDKPETSGYNFASSMMFS